MKRWRKDGIVHCGTTTSCCWSFLFYSFVYLESRYTISSQQSNPEASTVTQIPNNSVEISTDPKQNMYTELRKMYPFAFFAVICDWPSESVAFVIFSPLHLLITSHSSRSCHEYGFYTSNKCISTSNKEDSSRETFEIFYNNVPVWLFIAEDILGSWNFDCVTFLITDLFSYDFRLLSWWIVSMNKCV